MGHQQYPVEVQSDFLSKITRAKPVQALSELIWNSFDADAKRVTVSFDYNDLSTLSAVVIRDDGRGIPRAAAPEFFRRLGGSWKRPGATTEGGRFLHGQEGRGRFKAFAIGTFAEWAVGASLDHLQQHYAKYLEGVIEDNRESSGSCTDVDSELEAS